MRQMQNTLDDLGVTSLVRETSFICVEPKPQQVVNLITKENGTIVLESLQLAIALLHGGNPQVQVCYSCAVLSCSNNVRRTLSTRCLLGLAMNNFFAKCERSFERACLKLRKGNSFTTVSLKSARPSILSCIVTPGLWTTRSVC